MINSIEANCNTESRRACKECGGEIDYTRPKSEYCGTSCYRKMVRRSGCYKQRKKEWKKAYKASNPRLRASLRECGKMMRGEKPVAWREGSTAAYRVFLKKHIRRCDYCGQDCSKAHHIDHFIPVSLGGREQDWNLRVSCPSCNIQKGEKLPFGWVTNTRRRR